MRLAPLFLLTALLHAYVGLRIAPVLESAATGVGLGLALYLAVSAVLLPAGLLAPWLERRTTSKRLVAVLSWAGLLCMGFASSLFVLTLLRDLGLLLVAGLAWLAPGLVDSAAVTQFSGLAVPALAALMTAVGYRNARRVAAVREVEVPIAGLPAALEGFTIVQLSDLHVGPTIGRRWIERIVEATNRLDADVVAITGDLVDGSVQALAPHVAPLAGLRSRHGTYFVTGNHEYYSGAAAWVGALRQLGLTVLMNEHVVLERGGARLVLAGVTDWSAHHFDPAQRSDPAAALRGAPAGAPRVLLAHQPRSAEAASAAGFDLQLSGHTHGGQFWPWNHFVPLQQPYVAGLHRLGRLAIYISRGTGYWGPPKRFAAPSEITRLRLVAGPRA